MGELSQQIGKKLENYGSVLFSNLNWTLLAQNLEVNCTRQSHTSQSGTAKKTHGIDLLHGFYNPFTGMNEAVITECKNHLWKDFIPSKIQGWIEELVNTIECASTSPEVSSYLKENVLTTGILIFNSSDREYEHCRARDCLSKIMVPRRRTPIMVYFTDTARLDKWVALNEMISDIKQKNQEHKFGIIYPSIGGSQWERSDIITPNYLFSDYIISSYTTKKEIYNDIKQIDVKAIFCFDKIGEDSLIYMKDMINKLQVEARGDRHQELHVFYYPESASDIILVKNLFNKSQTSKTNIFVKFLKNRHLSPVDYGEGDD